MCGRYILVQKAEIIERVFNIVIPDHVDYKPSYNISPGKKGLIITNVNPHEVKLSTFGMTPHWAKKPMYLFNARAEGDQNKDNDPDYRGSMGIINKPSFRLPIRRQRCLVIADAFIEGTTKEKLDKPYLIYLRDRKPFAFAGIWDEWVNNETGEVFHGFSIITTVANSFHAKLPHHRSPVILEKEMEQKWLHSEHLADISWMLKPYPSEKMNGYAISNKIKDPRSTGLELIKPVGNRLLPEEIIKGHSELKLQGMGRRKIK